MITPHAQARMQQRGIPPGILDLLLSYGSVEHDHHGAEVYHFDEAAIRRLQHDIGREPVRRMHEYLNAYAVYGTDGTLVTTGHRYQRIRRKE